jgi:hypothetical protein
MRISLRFVSTRKEPRYNWAKRLVQVRWEAIRVGNRWPNSRGARDRVARLAEVDSPAPYGMMVTVSGVELTSVPEDAVTITL